MKKIILSLIGAAVVMPAFADVTNSMYGYLTVVNDSKGTTVILRRIDDLTSHGVFLSGIDGGVITLQPGEKRTLYYQVDYGVHAGGSIAVSAKCEMHMETEVSAKLYWLTVGGEVKAKFSSGASCQAAVDAQASAYTGIFPETAIYLDITGQQRSHGEEEPGCEFNGGNIALNYATASALSLNGENPKITSHGSSCPQADGTRFSFENDRPEPAYSSFYMPTSVVHIRSTEDSSPSKAPNTKANAQIRVAPKSNSTLSQ